jgi:glycosyltransferase involved in cell wall biosynthesis
MKILQSCGSVSWGGLEIMALKVSLLLKENGHEIHIICPKNSELEKHALKHSIKTMPLWNKSKSVLSPAQKLTRLIRSENYEIVHTHLSHDLWTIVPALKRSHSNAKLFLSKHMGSGIGKKDIFHKYLYNRVNHIFAVSSYVKQRVIETCPVNESKVSILYPGLNLENYNSAAYTKTEIKKELGIDYGSIVIGMAGRMSPGKGHEELLRAASILKEEYGKKIKFLAVGSASYGEEKYEKEIIELASGLNINDITQFTGYRNDIPRMMSIFDIFVFPSHEESFGIALTEAMAMELPVIASKNAGVLDIVVDNVTGLLVPPKDTEQLAGAIKTLIENVNLRESFGKAGRKRAEEIFNAKDELNILEEFYAG